MMVYALTTIETEVLGEMFLSVLFVAHVLVQLQSKMMLPWKRCLESMCQKCS